MLLSILLGVLAAAPAPADPSMPQLRRQGTAIQLVVDGKPFVIRGASSATPAPRTLPISSRSGPGSQRST